MTEKVAPKKNKYAYVIIIGLCMVVFAGSGLAFSCASVFYAVVADAFGIGKGTFSIYMTVLCLVMSFSMPLQGKLVVKMNIRKFIALAGVCFVVGICFYAMAPNVIFFYIGAVFQGLGVAIPAFVLVPLMVNRWFKKRNGFFIGLAMAFTGLTAIIMNPILSTVITTAGWRAAYWLEAAVAAVCFFVPALMFRNQPSDLGLMPVGAEEVAAEAAKKAATDDATENAKTPFQAAVSLKTAMHSAPFYFMCILAGATSFVQALNFYWTAYATALGYGLVLASVIGSVAMLGQMIGKIFLGALSDKKFKLSVILAYSFGLVGLLGALLIGGAAGTTMILVFIFLFGLTYAAGAVETPVITQRCFGAGKDYAKIYANIMSVGTFCAAIGSTFYGFIIDATGGYTVSFLIGVVLSVVCLTMAFMALAGSKKLPRDEVDDLAESAEAAKAPAESEPASA